MIIPLKIWNTEFPSPFYSYKFSLKEEWDVKEEDSPATFIEVSLEVKQEDADDLSVFHSVGGDCTSNKTNYYKVGIYFVDLLLNFPHFNEYLAKYIDNNRDKLSMFSGLRHFNYHFYMH